MNPRVLHSTKMENGAGNWLSYPIQASAAVYQPISCHLVSPSENNPSWGSPCGSVVKNPPANAGDVRDSGSIPGSEDPLEQERAICSSILAWKIPWTEESGGL